MAKIRSSPEGITQQVAKALSHPLRVRIVAALQRGVSSPNQISLELGEPLGNVSYHVKTLLELGCVELVKTEPRRGAVEHYYQATDRSFFSDTDWDGIPPSARKAVSGAMLADIGKQTTDALRAGTLDDRDGSQVNNLPLVLDEQGWKDVAKVIRETGKQVLKIQTEAGKRLAKEKGIEANLVTLFFESSGEEKSKKG